MLRQSVDLLNFVTNDTNQVVLEGANFRLSLDMGAPIPVLEQVLYHVFDFDSFIRRIVSSYNFRILLDKSFPIW